MSLIVDRRNLDFILFEMLETEALLAHPQFAHIDRPTIAQIFDSAQAMAEEVYHPFAAAPDAAPPRFVDGEAHIMPQVAPALAAYADAGFAAQAFAETDGGFGLPYSVSMAVNGMFSAANLSVANYSMLTAAAAHLLVACGTAAQKETYARPLIEGRWLGTMCLSEPQAGSSLADITTRAEAAGADRYRLSGTKMWISGAGHRMTDNIVHLVLARLPDAPPGVKGISLFLVPQRLVNEDGSLGDANNVTLVGLNHKMGQRGTTNCMLNFGESGPTFGYLVGQPHHGLKAMFHMMNEARVAVGHGAVMLGLAGFLYSRDYAFQRLQGRRPGQKDLQSPQVPLVEHADIRRMLLAQKAYVEGGLALSSYCALLVDQITTSSGATRDDLILLLDLLTPIAKSWPSEYCLEANKLAIQILGGAGYTQDHPVERFYRDNRLNHIHEGSWGIQGIDLLGRKVRMADGRGLHLLTRRITATIEDADKLPEFKDQAADLRAALAMMNQATAATVSSANPERALANATLYLDAAGTVCVAWLWIWQALVASRALESAACPSRLFYEAKISAFRYYFVYVLPAAHQALSRVEEEESTFFLLSPQQLMTT